MERKTIWREFFRGTVPGVLGTLGVSCYILADTFFISAGLGTAGLAALNLAIPVYNVIHGAGLMLGMGGGTLFSIARSRGEERRANGVFTTAVALAVLFAAVFMALGAFGAETLARLLGADGETLAMTATYLRWLLLFAPAFLLNDIFLCFARNDDAPRLSMAATLVGSFSNILLDYVFIFPLNWGIFGAIFATGLSPVISLLILLPRPAGYRLTVGAWEKPGRLLSLGVSSLIAQSAAAVVMVVFNVLILQLEGNTGVAAYGVVANIALVVAAIYTGLAQGMQPLVSRTHAVGDSAAARQALRCGAVSVLVLSAVLYGLLAALREPIAAAFNSEGNAALQHMAVTGLLLYFTSNLPLGYNTLLSVYFPSVERSAPAQVLTILRGAVLVVPLTIAMAAAWGMTGVWLAYPVTETAAALLGYAVYRRQK